MPITFPIAMPAAGAAGQYFEPERVDYQSPRSDGRIGGVTAGFPLWHARWTLGRTMSLESSEAWRAFVALLRGQQRPFFGADQARPYPLSAAAGFDGLARAGGGAFDGAATSWALDADRDALTLHGLPAGFVISVGDYVMLRWETAGSARRALHRAVQPAVASGSGSATYPVEPPVPMLAPGTAVADLARPCCVMRLKPETRIGEMSRSKKVDGQILAIQDLRD